MPTIELLAEVAILTQQRNELLEALELLAKAIIPFNLFPVNTPGVTESRDAFQQATAAIAKARGA